MSDGKKPFWKGLLSSLGDENKSYNPEDFIKATSKEELNSKVEQFKEDKYLNDFTKRVQNELYNKFLIYESSRIASYSDYDLMEGSPIIGAALDAFMEESCTINSEGKMLHIFSESERIKKILEELFYDRLEINTSLPLWTRNMPIKHDSVIPLLNGENLTIKKLSERIKSGEELWTYSVQLETNKILPGKITWCDLTRKNEKIIKIGLDDGTYVETTLDHEFMLRNGSFISADKLKITDSLMPFYTRTSKKSSDCINGYEKVYNPSTNHFKFTHRVVSNEFINEEFESKIDDIIQTHHKDFNKLNNDPQNLERMGKTKHLNLHISLCKDVLHGNPSVIEKRLKALREYLTSDKRRKFLSEKMSGIYPIPFNKYNNSDQHATHNIIRSDAMLKNWSNIEYKEATRKKMIISYGDLAINYIKNILSNNDYIPVKVLCERLKTDTEFIKLSNKNNKRGVFKSLNTNTFKTIILRETGLEYHELLELCNSDVINNKYFNRYKKLCTTIKNHKVTSIEILDTNSDVYCMEVRGPNGENDRHNFPICSKNENGEYTRNGVFVSNCKLGDNFLYLDINSTDGVTRAIQLPNIEMERKEPGLNLRDDDDKVKFNWRGKKDSFTNYQIAHFRLLTDDKFLPYGCSILHKVRKVWRQILMSEDAMLVYRLTRAAERRIFKVFVGGIDTDDVEAYVDEFANRFKRNIKVDPATGQMDLRTNFLNNIEDFFVPVRDMNEPVPIETLQGGSNMSEIVDIEYLQKKLFAGLRVPKPFLGFEEATGDAQNLVMKDVRFSRTINRVQQSLLQELNKIAIIHLYINGFEEELDNFKLSLNNPSTQAESLKIDQLQSKVTLYKDAIDSTNGFQAMSSTKAKKDILGMSDSEIMDEFNKIRLEKAAEVELQNTANVIKKSGLFDKADTMYGIPQDNITDTTIPVATDNLETDAPTDETPVPETTATENTAIPPPENLSEGLRKIKKLGSLTPDEIQKIIENNNFL